MLARCQAYRVYWGWRIKCCGQWSSFTPKRNQGDKYEIRASVTNTGVCSLFSSAPPPWQLGAETGVQSSDLQWMRNVLRVMPLAVLPITIHFPAVSNGLGAGSKLSHQSAASWQAGQGCSS